ncbi:MAG TPA: anthranilate phosphoribosyltransferase, partial [Candidatus Polarisedimenticolia bacterium]|nr:anthranilate phosphoribosyltransferase [Candidatus Polarisedimenticolia bacterium]
LFNWLGPLANPALATHQLVGVADGERARTVAEVLSRLGVTRALVIHGVGGLDELSLEAGNVAYEATARGVSQAEGFEASRLGLAPSGTTALRGGDAATNAGIMKSVLSGERGPKRDALILNAAAALWISGRVPSLEQGGEEARAQIDSGNALRVLDRFVGISKKLGEN